MSEKIDLQDSDKEEKFQLLQESFAKTYCEGVVKKYIDLFKPINTEKKLVSEILGIEETEEDYKLVLAFEKIYEGWFFTSGKEQKILFNQFVERAKSVLDKRLEQLEKEEIEEDENK